MNIPDILVEVGKHAFILAVFVGLLAFIIKLLYDKMQTTFNLVADKQQVFEKDVEHKFQKVDDRFKNVDEHIQGVRQNVHKLTDNMNVGMANIQNEVRYTNQNVKLLAVSLGKNPLDYIKEKE